MSTLDLVRRAVKKANENGDGKRLNAESKRHYQNFLDNNRAVEFNKMQEDIRAYRAKNKTTC